MIYIYIHIHIYIYTHVYRSVCNAFTSGAAVLSVSPAFDFWRRHRCPQLRAGDFEVPLVQQKTAEAPSWRPPWDVMNISWEHHRNIMGI